MSRGGPVYLVAVGAPSRLSVSADRKVLREEMLAFRWIYEQRQLLVDHRVSGPSKGLIVSASSLLVRAPVRQIAEYLGRKRKKGRKG